MVGGTLQAVAVISDCLELGLWFEGLELGRQAAWRPGTIGMVLSSWLAALCKQLLCLKVIARYLGSGYGLKLGRQAAWRPGCNRWMVSSSWLAALCKQLLCLKVTARYLGSGCGLKLGRQAAWRPGTIGMVSSSWLAALCKQLLYLKVIAGTWALAAGSNSVVKLLGGRVQSGWCRQVGWRHFKGSCCV